MKLIALALAGALSLGASNASAADTAGMMKPINGFLDATLHPGKPLDGIVTASTSLVDEVPPYHWSGPGAVKTWLGDVGAWAKANGVTDLDIKAGTPTRV